MDFEDFEMLVEKVCDIFDLVCYCVLFVSLLVIVLLWFIVDVFGLMLWICDVLGV